MGTGISILSTENRVECGRFFLSFFRIARRSNLGIFIKYICRAHTSAGVSLEISRLPLKRAQVTQVYSIDHHSPLLVEIRKQVLVEHTGVSGNEKKPKYSCL